MTARYSRSTILATRSRWILAEPQKMVWARPLRYSGTISNMASGIAATALNFTGLFYLGRLPDRPMKARGIDHHSEFLQIMRVA
jgi:hypothetical protein